MTAAADLEEYRAIEALLQHYLNGAMSGHGEVMRPAFHPDATVFGYVGADLFAGPIESLFTWNDANGAAENLKSQITKIEIIGTIASVRVELDDWTGHRFTDLFNLLKVDGKWRIMNKIFHTHN